MNEKYIQIFNGYRGAYGVANIKNAYVDPDSGKLRLKPGDYRWNYQELTDDIYTDHLNGKKSIGIQPCNEEGETKFGLIDIDPGNYKGIRNGIDIAAKSDYVVFSPLGSVIETNEIVWMPASEVYFLRADCRHGFGS